jgi:hypothetical protein
MIQIVDYISQGEYGLFEVDDDGETRLLQRAKDIKSLLYFGSFAPDPTVMVSECCMALLDEQPQPIENIFNEIINKLLEDVIDIDYNEDHEEDEWFDPSDNDW